ncbi:MAG: response regulator transcription factor [Deltaproteobacteria bacterium]|nr:response regulator transcription factor [Deltaproteobacteria bacterium]
MTEKCILAVDDEPDVLQLLEYHLASEGFRVICATSGEEAIEIATREIPDLILLDIMLPGISGLEVLKYLQRNQPTMDVPVIYLSARAEETDIVLGLELGACDYVTKPFSIRVLISRIRAVLGERNRFRPTHTTSDVIRIRDMEIFSGKRRVTVRGKDVGLTQAEFRILELLAKKPGWVFSRKHIRESIHDLDDSVTERSIDVHVYGLRRKLGDGKHYIETVRHAGYRLAD